MKTKPLKFHATCRSGYWAPFHTLTPGRQAAIDAMPRPASYLRWNKKLALQEGLVLCQFETDDTTALEAHMREVHGKRPLTPTRAGEQAALKKLSAWPGRVSGLTDEGRPFETTKALAKELETCDGCGLVAEIRGGVGSVTYWWWQEHLNMCVERAAS